MKDFFTPGPEMREHFVRHFMHHGRHGHHGRFGRRFGRRGGGRGNIRFEILSVIAEGPRHGYDIMLELEKRRGGLRPSPGSIYPALQMLEDAGYAKATESDGKRIYEITDSGRAHLAEQAQNPAFDADEEDDVEFAAMRAGAQSLRALVEAAKQVARLGNPKLIKATVDILDAARRDIYKILADEG